MTSIEVCGREDCPLASWSEHLTKAGKLRVQLQKAGHYPVLKAAEPPRLRLVQRRVEMTQQEYVRSRLDGNNYLQELESDTK